MRLIIISGLSGSGKTIALHTLEDEGYYCIDNLPPGLLSRSAELLAGANFEGYEKVAVGIDIRSGIHQLADFPALLEGIQALGLDVQTLYLEAEDSDLIKRFSETRRPHPLARGTRTLVDAIRIEREAMVSVACAAELRVDTSHLNIHQLRSLIRERVVGSTTEGTLSLLVQSFGYKGGVPLDSDYVFDVRCLPNPHWQPQLRNLTGRDPEVAAFLESHLEVREMVHAMAHFLTPWISRFLDEHRRYVGISIGCTGGQHRSVYVAERLAGRLTARPGLSVSVRHRELAGHQTTGR